MRRIWVYLFSVGLVACGQGVSEDPLANVASGGTTPGETGGTAAVSGAGGAATGGSAPVAGTGGEASDGNGGSGGEAATGASSGTGGTSQPVGKPTGSVDCEDGSDCASGQCLPDVSGVKRCCAAYCPGMERVCSTTGDCVCSSQRREEGGACLLIEGQPCRQDAECASNSCADGVCCAAACDGVCERCAASGACTLDPVDASCAAPFQCTARGRCRLPLGATCGSAADCESELCEPTDSGAPACCATACRGLCQTCGPSGACDDFPLYDDDCPPLICDEPSPCVTYRTPALGACGANGACAQCEPIYTRAGTPCGVGSQCDGAGVCSNTGLGRIAAGQRHTCAIRDNGNVLCWGDNRAGQLGARFDLTAVGDDEMPFEVENLELDFEDDVVQITAGTQHTCVLFSTGGVRCWGSIIDHPLFGTIHTILGVYPPPYNSAHVVDPLAAGNVWLAEPATQISAAPDGATICALLKSGKISCWGLNFFGNLGIGTNQSLLLANLATLPVVDLGGRAVEVRAAFAHTCALLEDGRVKCWGEATAGRIGSGDNANRLSPQGTVDVGEPVKSIAVGFGHTCVVLERGALRCWGLNDHGQLGYGHTAMIGDDETPAAAATMPGPSLRPVLGGDVPLGGPVTQVVTLANARATCALLVGGSVRCWGQNDFGQLGYGHNLSGSAQHTPEELRSIPGTLTSWGGDVDVGGQVLALPEGGRCALRTLDNLLYCWGPGSYGEVGALDAFPNGSLTLRPKDLGPVHWW